MLCYIDDILITSTNDEEHMKNLSDILTRLKQQGIKLRKDKCKFMATSVEYLGHKIDAKIRHTSECKVEAIQKAPVPKNT